MIRQIRDSFIVQNYAPGIDLQEKDMRYVTFEYNSTNSNDIFLKNLITKILHDFQPRCENCQFSQKIDNYLDCKKYGFLDWCESVNPFHDGSLCKDYKKKKLN